MKHRPDAPGARGLRFLEKHVVAHVHVVPPWRLGFKKPGGRIYVRDPEDDFRRPKKKQNNQGVEKPEAFFSFRFG